MNKCRIASLFVSLCFCMSQPWTQAESSPQPIDAATVSRDWLLWSILSPQVPIGIPDTASPIPDSKAIQPPFSFTLDGKPSQEFLKSWVVSITHSKLDQNRTSHTLIWHNPDSSLELRWEVLEYSDFKTIEWTVHLKNIGKTDTAIIENLRAIDARFVCVKDKPYQLRHWNGTRVNAEDFAPQIAGIEPGKELTFAPSGGRATGGCWPYYNIDGGDEGMIVVVSWAGRWYAKYHRNADSTLSLTAGQDKTHFKLLPGETVRTPMIVLQFWKGGNWVDAQNRWRQWMIRYNIPRPGGKDLALPLFAACSSHQFAEMTKANEQNQKEFIDSYLQKGLKINYWWMDAGWYVGAAEKGWPWTGTWEVDRSPNRFPNGLRAISDYAHSKNVKTIVWFEPERVAAGTWLATEHPDWILGGAAGGLLNLGNPDAWNWLVSHIDKIITDEGIDLYRQDYNIDPLEYWQKNDPADRQGITENKYVMGYLAYWDELLRRHPGMLIDSCASGGHRNDLETMRRSIPLLRSDYLFEPVGQQAHTYGLSFWLPVHGTAYNPSNTQGWGWGTGQGLLAYGPYIRRSNMCPANTGCFDFRAAVDETLIMALYQEWLDIAPNYWGDYYPLTDYTLSQKDWIAWQFHRPDSKAGFVQAFRHDQSIHPSAQLMLLGLKPDKTYLLNDYNTKTQSRMTGKQLMEEGLVIELKNKPDATTIGYREE